MRMSLKRVQTLANSIGLEVIKNQELGNRKDYWYSYTLVNGKSRNVIMRDTTLLKIYNFIIYDMD